MLTTIQNAESLKQACKDAMRHAVTLLRLNCYRVQAFRLWELVTDAPNNLAESTHPEMHKMSFCGECIARLSSRIEYFPLSDQQTFAEAKHFFVNVLPAIDRPSRELLNAAVDGVLDFAESAEAEYERVLGYGSVDRDREFIPRVPVPKATGGSPTKV